MTTSDASWPGKLRKIGELERPDHHLLGVDDRCYFIGEYTAHESYGFSTTNDLINNLKKKPSTKSTAQWKYKLQAIERIGRTIGVNFKPEALPTLTFVPVPPSKLTTDPEYDDRMLAVARAIPNASDVRDLLFTSELRGAAHEGTAKRDPDVLITKLGIREDLLNPRPRHIILLDDVITTGCSFIACRSLLMAHLPDVQVSGVFVARRVPKSPFEPVDL